MKRILAIFTFLSLILPTVPAQTKFTADLAQTRLSWLGEYVSGQHTGTIILQSGWITWEENRIAAGEFIIDMSSIKESDSNERFVGHLKSDDFFGVEKFPFSKLIVTGSTSFDKGTGVITGTLTIKGVTNPIEFKAVLQRQDNGMLFFANITVDRSKYNIRYGSGTFFDNLGDKTIFDDFKLKVNLSVKE